MKTGILSGSFDPFTVGHENLVRRAAKIVDKVVILICRNADKKNMYPDDVRLQAIKACFPEGNVEVEYWDGLLAEKAKTYENPVIIRGARTGSDFDYELQVAAMNRDIGGIDTIVFPTEGKYQHISSTYARDLIRYGKNVDGVVPQEAAAVLAACEKKNG